MPPDGENQLNGSDRPEIGRAPNGTYLPGHRSTGGRPRSKASLIRRRIARQTSLDDVDEIWEAVKAEAKLGKSWAVKEVFDRLTGRAANAPDAPMEGEGEAVDVNINLTNEPANQPELLATPNASGDEPEECSRDERPSVGEDPCCSDGDAAPGAGA